MSIAPGDIELSRFLSLTAHEIRNPLSPTLGFISFVMRDKKSEISTQQRQWLQMAINSCGRLHDLANQVSEYARMVKGEVTLNRTPTDLGTVLSDAIAAVPPSPERNVTIESPKQPGPTLQIDGSLLTKAFTSILTALRLEVGGSGALSIAVEDEDYQGKTATWILIGDVDQMNVLRAQPKNALGWFDDKERGNLGVSLWLAKWILGAHGGGIWAPPSAPKGGGAIIALPDA